MLKKLGLKENESIDHPWINKAIERAQEKVEARNFDIRKTLIKFDDVMNDQRQVIFSQRLNILKSQDISEMLNSFLDDSIGTLEQIKNDYQKSNDKKAYLAGIKNITGNALNEDQLISITSLNKEDFIKKIKDAYEIKKSERIKLIGVEENNDIEKKIFLQIIDFSWRSHLQYLEQLRQVIGLRSYGQKDPLSEFKKEAFALFEVLLEKIKTDVVKFLLNLNLVVSSESERKSSPEKTSSNETKKRKVQRNEKCPCGSGKKYKHCCGSI
jgi:preprotein translocase subunit SecA